MLTSPGISAMQHIAVLDIEIVIHRNLNLYYHLINSVNITILSFNFVSKTT